MWLDRLPPRVFQQLLIALVFTIMSTGAIAADEPLPGYASMKLLFCAYGGIGAQPSPMPANFENQFAVAVVELNSSREVSQAPLPTLSLLYGERAALTTKRVISVEQFDEPYVRGEGNMAFYLNSNLRGHTVPWNRTIPGGMIHLRVRVALATQQDSVLIPRACRVTLGPYSVQGPVDGSWPT